MYCSEGSHSGTLMYDSEGGHANVVSRAEGSGIVELCRMSPVLGGHISGC